MIITGSYPNLRLRRSRKFNWSRRLVQDNDLSYNDFILPIFLTEGKAKKVPINSMPNVFRYSIDKLKSVVDKALKLGIPMVALFPNTNPKKKDKYGVLIDSTQLKSFQNDISPLINILRLLTRFRK